MKRTLIAILTFAIVDTGCKKTAWHYDRFESRDTVNSFYVQYVGGPFNPSGPKTIQYASFGLASRITAWGTIPDETKKTVFTYYGSEETPDKHHIVDESRYYLKYVGSVPLINADSFQFNDGIHAGYLVGPSLLGKPIFEMRKVTNDSLVETFYFSTDSASVLLLYNFDYWDEKGKLVTPPHIPLPKDSLTNALLQYLSPSNFADCGFFATAYPPQ